MVAMNKTVNQHLLATTATVPVAIYHIMVVISAQRHVMTTLSALMDLMSNTALVIPRAQVNE